MTFLYIRSSILHSICLVALSSLVLIGCSTIDRGNFGHMKRSLSHTSYGHEVIQDPTNKAPTDQVERFELRHGDCSSNQTWSDCNNDRERTELSQQGNNRYGSSSWYGWYFYVPKSYKNIYPVKVALGQFHQRSESPVFMFQNSSGGLVIDRQANGWSMEKKRVIKRDELRGKWHRIEVHAKWTRNETGFFRVFVNGQEKYNYQGKTAKKGTYFKYGIYRSFVSRYLGENKIPTQVIYYSGVRKGTNRQSLEITNQKD